MSDIGKNDRPKPDDCGKYRPTREFSHFDELIDNVPYMLMVLVGSVLLFRTFGETGWRWAAALLYVAYGVAGAFWIIIFVCPYCHFYGTRSCPCGYGQIAKRVVPAKDGSLFAQKFRKHVPVIVPLWIIPVAAGVFSLIRGFSWISLSILLIFAIDAFVILPVISRRYGCAHCDQKNECPWMKHDTH